MKFTLAPKFQLDMGTDILQASPELDTTKKALAIMKIHGGVSDPDTTIKILGQFYDKDLDKSVRKNLKQGLTYHWIAWDASLTEQVWREMQQTKDPIVQKVMSLDPASDKRVQKVLKQVKEWEDKEAECQKSASQPHPIRNSECPSERLERSDSLEAPPPPPYNE